MFKIHTKLIKKLLIPVLVLLIAISVIGCQEEEKPPSAPVAPRGLPSPSELCRTSVPNTDLDVYLYIKQDNPTTLPADMFNMSFDLEVESLAIWGVPVEDNFTFGYGLTLSSSSDASLLYAQITPEENSWTALSGSTIYFVEGSGIAAETLKTAISSSDFKNYDDKKSLEAVAALPNDGTTKLGGVAVVKPSKALMSHVTKGADSQGFGVIDLILGLVRLDVVVAGLYSPHQIEVAQITQMVESGSIRGSNIDILVLVKSGLPGFIVAPVVKKFLAEFDFTQTTLGEITLYKRTVSADNGEPVYILGRVEGNYIFAAISGQEAYAQTLITRVNKW